jgi:hypothetical protein
MGNPTGLIVGTRVAAHEHKTGADVLAGRTRDAAKEIVKALMQRLEEQGGIAAK